MKKGILVLLAAGNLAYAGLSVWSFIPINSPHVSVSATGAATVSYTVTNNSTKAHQLVLSSSTPSGISQSGGACVLSGLGSTCALTLNINGSALPSDNVSGGPILCQANSNGTPNLNYCYQPNPGDELVITRTPNAATLLASISQLALSITGIIEYDITGAHTSGLARKITITNVGSNLASGLNITYPTWPTDTISSSTCGETLAVGATCTIEVTPGAYATSNCNTSHSAPTPGTITVSATNVATPVTTDVVVLGYSCQYQGGYVYAFDDTTPIIGSVGGKVVTTSDQQAADYPYGVIWSSNGGSGIDTANTSFDILPGIDETSTSAIGSPTYSTFDLFFLSTYTNENPFTFVSFSKCNGALDGSCNTGNLLTFYNQFITHNTQANGGTPRFTASVEPTEITYYAAGLCKQTIASYSDWYLPAICEMGYDQSYNGSGCGQSNAPTLQNIQKSLIDLSGMSTPAGRYWSSTESSDGPQELAWNEYFAPMGGSNQTSYFKTYQLGVRCSRALTL